MTKYKVWIHIEEIEEEKDHYREIEEPQEAGKFTSEQDARQFVDDLMCENCNPDKGLHIDPPPAEDGLFRVVYEIDVYGTDAKAAAQQTYKIMTDPDSLAPVLHVLDPEGNQSTIDLSQD